MLQAACHWSCTANRLSESPDWWSQKLHRRNLLQQSSNAVSSQHCQVKTISKISYPKAQRPPNLQGPTCSASSSGTESSYAQKMDGFICDEFSAGPRDPRDSQFVQPIAIPISAPPKKQMCSWANLESSPSFTASAWAWPGFGSMRIIKVKKSIPGIFLPQLIFWVFVVLSDILWPSHRVTNPFLASCSI